MLSAFAGDPNRVGGASQILIQLECAASVRTAPARRAGTTSQRPRHRPVPDAVGENQQYAQAAWLYDLAERDGTGCDS